FFFVWDVFAVSLVVVLGGGSSSRSSRSSICSNSRCCGTSSIRTPISRDQKIDAIIVVVTSGALSAHSRLGSRSIAGLLSAACSLRRHRPMSSSSSSSYSSCSPSSPSAKIRVCQGKKCRSAGSEIVLFEIEELAKGFENCTVEASRCLGACRKAPNAEVVRGQAEGICTRISDAERSAAVVARATGAMPCFEDPRLARKLADARMRRVRSRARAEGKWNAALAGFPEQVMSRSGRERLELQLEMSQLMASAGLWEEALSHVAEVEARSGDSLAVAMERARLLGRLGRSEELEAILRRRVSAMRLDRRLAKEVASSLRNCVADCATAPGLDGARRPIEKYGLWYLEGTTKVSRHSAIYHFRSEDEARGTPLPKKRKRGAQHSTWHTTLLAGVGANSEGPLPWVERDYTPVSTAAEWEQGKCDILIKIYRDGLATSWLHRQDPGCSVRLSQPMKTLDVPSLVTDRHQATFEPATSCSSWPGPASWWAPRYCASPAPATA
ncbi:unnamed protein product, partial [Prorocentrum cordatum]